MDVTVEYDGETNDLVENISEIFLIKGKKDNRHPDVLVTTHDAKEWVKELGDWCHDIEPLVDFLNSDGESMAYVVDKHYENYLDNQGVIEDQDQFNRIMYNEFYDYIETQLAEEIMKITESENMSDISNIENLMDVLVKHIPKYDVNKLTKAHNKTLTNFINKEKNRN